MAYKPVQYDFFNPMEELVPLVNMYNKAYLALDSRLNEYIDWLSSSSELLNRDEQAMELKRKYENDLNTMADALAVGDLRTAHSVNPRTYLYPLKVKQKLAELLSKNIQEQTQRSPLYIFTRRFSVDTPLDEVALDPSYDMIPISKFEEIGKAIGSQLNDTNPEVVGHIMNGATALIQQGVPLEEVMDLVAKNSPLSLAILKEVDNANLVDEYEKYRVRRAVTHGIFLGVGTKTTTMHDSSYRTPEQQEADEEKRKDREAEQALEYMYRTGGDYSKLLALGKAFEQRNSKGEVVVLIGSKTYKTTVLGLGDWDTLEKIAIENNPELGQKGNEDALREEIERLKSQNIRVAIPEAASSKEGADELTLVKAYLAQTKVGDWKPYKGIDGSIITVNTIKDSSGNEVYRIYGRGTKLSSMTLEDAVKNLYHLYPDLLVVFNSIWNQYFELLPDNEARRRLVLVATQNINKVDPSQPVVDSSDSGEWTLAIKRLVNYHISQYIKELGDNDKLKQNAAENQQNATKAVMEAVYKTDKELLESKGSNIDLVITSLTDLYADAKSKHVDLDVLDKLLKRIDEFKAKKARGSAVDNASR